MNKYLTSNIEQTAGSNQLSSIAKIYRIHRRNSAQRWLWGMLILMGLLMFLPWTQNIRANGSITTLRQEQRPQEVNSIIAGKVVKWYVAEGNFVKAGDTILQLGEVKVDYFDPQLLERTQQQINAKQQTIVAYNNKANTTITQAQALAQGRELKLQSLENKISQQLLKLQTDETDLLALNNELNVYKRQIDGARIMLDSGAISLSEFEKRKINYQNGLAKVNSINNKLLQNRQELANLKLEQSLTIQEFTDKISKLDGDRFSSISSASSTEAEVSKLQNQYSNYDARNKLYFITAPQSGQITKAKKAGIGEMLNEGEMIVEIVPDNIQYAVEMYIEPKDLPLISIGQKVQFIFDGFPVIVFSGWPESSYGTFSGKVTTIETSVSNNGKFRTLVIEDPDDKPWPKQLKIGSGASGIALLKDVPVYYEFWRNINGFPPEYYIAEPIKINTDKKGK